MPVAVYPEIAAFAGRQGAVYVGARSFSTLALTSFRNSLSASLGQILALAVRPYAVRFDAAAGTGTGKPAGEVDVIFDRRGSDIVFRTAEPLKLDFTLGIIEKGALVDTLGTLTLELRDLAFVVGVADDALVCSPAEAQMVPGLVRDPGFDQVLANRGLDRDTATRVEGMLLYSALATVVKKSMASPAAIDLKRLFPSVTFMGRIDYGLSSDGAFIFLKGERGLARRTDGACDCPDVGNGFGAVRPGQAKGDTGANPQGAPGTSVGSIVLGGPTPVQPGPDVLGHRRRGEGDSGVYMSREMVEATVAGPFPGFRIDLSDNGFIGWKAAGFVDFDQVPVFTWEPQFGRFYIDLSFRAEVYGSVHVDLGKLGTIRVTEFSAEQAGPGANTIRIGCYVVIGTGGVYLKPVLEDVHIDPYEVFLRVGTLIGTPFGGWGAVIGFIFDKILSQIIAWKIPSELDLALRKSTAKIIFPIIEASYAAEIAGQPQSPLMALYEGGGDGLLISSARDNW